MSEIINIIIKIAFAVSSVAITYYILPFIKDLRDKYADEKFRQFLDEAIRSAEQVIKGSGKGAEKKDIVLKTATAWLLKHGIDMSETELNNMIESMVFNMNSKEIEK